MTMEGADMPKNNRTHTTRAARALAAHSHLGYQAALTLVRRARVAPRPEVFDDPANVARFIAEHQGPAAAAPLAVARFAGRRFDVELNDSIGHTRDTWLFDDLFDDMRTAVEADPAAGVWVSEEEGRWTVKSAASAPADIVWADSNGEFTLANGATGNPGCDECGTLDAAARVDGTYLCATELTRRGIGLPVQPDGPADDDEDDEGERCSGCGANLAHDAGEGYDGCCGSCADVMEMTCAVCDGEMVEDPDGSDGVMVHDPDAPAPEGWEQMTSHDLDEDHTAHNVWE